MNTNTINKISKIFLTMTLTLLLGWNGFGQTETVSITGGSQSSKLPINSSENYSFSQSIYLGSEIGKTGKIKSLTFKLKGSPGNNSSWKNWEVGLAETSDTEFTNQSTSTWVQPVYKMINATQVFSGNITYNQSAKTIKITLTADFSYNHNKNLVVQVYDRTVGNSVSTVNFDLKKTSKNRSIEYNSYNAVTYNRKDYNFPRVLGMVPAIDIEIEGDSPTPTTQTPDAILDFCEGDKVELTSENTATTYEWTKIGGKAKGTTNAKDYLVSKSITTAENGDLYKLKLINGDTCSDEYILKINVKVKPDVTTVEKIADLCGSGTAKFKITGTKGAIVTYQIGSEKVTTTTLKNGEATIYSTSSISKDVTIKVTKVQLTGGCEVTFKTAKTATVKVKESPKVTGFTVTNETFCGFKTKAQFNITGTPEAVVTYNQTGGIKPGKNKTVTLDKKGNKPIEVTLNASSPTTTITLVKITKDGCDVTLTNTKTVTAKAEPIFTSVEAKETPLCGSGNAEFVIKGTKGAKVTYKINNGTNKTETIGVTGRATVTVTGANTNQTITVTEVAEGTCKTKVSSKNTTTVTITTKPKAIIKKKL